MSSVDATLLSRSHRLSLSLSYSFVQIAAIAALQSHRYVLTYPPVSLCSSHSSYLWGTPAVNVFSNNCHFREVSADRSHFLLTARSRAFARLNFGNRLGHWCASLLPSVAAGRRMRGCAGGNSYQLQLPPRPQPRITHFLVQSTRYSVLIPAPPHYHDHRPKASNLPCSSEDIGVPRLGGAAQPCCTRLPQ